MDASDLDASLESYVAARSPGSQVDEREREYRRAEAPAEDREREYRRAEALLEERERERNLARRDDRDPPPHKLDRHRASVSPPRAVPPHLRERFGAVSVQGFDRGGSRRVQSPPPVRARSRSPSRRHAESRDRERDVYVSSRGRSPSPVAYRGRSPSPPPRRRSPSPSRRYRSPSPQRRRRSPSPRRRDASPPRDYRPSSDRFAMREGPRVDLATGRVEPAPRRGGAPTYEGMTFAGSHTLRGRFRDPGPSQAREISPVRRRAGTPPLALKNVPGLPANPNRRRSRSRSPPLPVSSMRIEELGSGLLRIGASTNIGGVSTIPSEVSMES
jgi:hypothetical protein